ncbi:MAG: hypothetical protein ACI9YT_003065 [Halobacteriales archaeon]|jgi:hypothetical protein
MDRLKVGIGALLLAVSSGTVLASGIVGTSIPLVGLALASLGLGVGTLVVGTSGSDGRPV